MSTTRESRARGVMLGQAIGDALGTTVEFSHAEQIALRAEGDGWPAELVGKGPFRLAPGQVTDDTELALALGRSLAAAGRFDDDAVARAYVGWLRSEPFDVGNTTLRAFDVEDPASPGLASVLRARADRQSQANGSLMRVSPLALFGASAPRSELAAWAARDATLSHPHPVCQAAGAVFCATIAEALETGRGGPELFDWARTFASTEPLAAPVRSWLERAATSYPEEGDRQHQGWVKLAFTIAFYELRHARDFESALVKVVRWGGDADTNGAIVGALLGSVFGADALPERWRRTVLACVTRRPRASQCGDLLELADVLAAGPR